MSWQLSGVSLTGSVLELAHPGDWDPGTMAGRIRDPNVCGWGDCLMLAYQQIPRDLGNDCFGCCEARGRRGPWAEADGASDLRLAGCGGRDGWILALRRKTGGEAAHDESSIAMQRAGDGRNGSAVWPLPRDKRWRHSGRPLAGGKLAGAIVAGMLPTAAVARLIWRAFLQPET